MENWSSEDLCFKESLEERYLHSDVFRKFIFNQRKCSYLAVFPGGSLGMTEATPDGMWHVSLLLIYTIPKQNVTQQEQMSGFVF